MLRRSDTSRKNSRLLDKFVVSKKNDKASVEVDPKHFFWLHNDGPIKTVHELIEALKTMTDEQFDHHTKGGRNDFANWLWYVFNHKECADKVFRARTRQGTIRAIEKFF